MSENEVKNPESDGETTVAEEPTAEKTTKKAKPASATASKKTEKTASIDEVIASIKSMTVLDLAELVKTLETEFGVSAAAPVMVAAAAGAPAAAVAAVEEKTEFTVILKTVGANKINVIKAVRELTSLGLKESKDLVESAPKPVKEGITKEEAATAKQKLEEAGATADIT